MADRKGEILRKLKTVTSVPPSALRAMKVLQDPNANMGEVVQIIAYDPGLTTNILKMANSSYFGCARSISSLREAVVRLGAANIFKLITASIANLVLNKNIKGYGMTSGELWEHSIAVAVAAENVAALIKDQEASKMAFTAALLHDVGKIVLSDFFDETVNEEVTKNMAQGKSMFEAEKISFGINHADVGARLLASWNIPNMLVESVRWHHAPDFCRDTICAAIVSYCDYICIKYKIGSTKEQQNMKLHSAKLSLSERDIEEIVARTRDSFEKIKDIFSKQS